jgi:hypothetical protein
MACYVEEAGQIEVPLLLFVSETRVESSGF